MIVGCYTMDLYCDHPLGGQYQCNEWPGQFTGHTEGECLRKARKCGWTVDKEFNQVVCPAHRALDKSKVV